MFDIVYVPQMCLVVLNRKDKCLNMLRMLYYRLNFEKKLVSIQEGREESLSRSGQLGKRRECSIEYISELLKLYVLSELLVLGLQD